MSILLSGFEFWVLLLLWQEKIRTLWMVWTWYRKTERIRWERERKRVHAHTQSLSLFTFSSCVYWIDPLLHVSSPGWQQSSKETWNKRDFDSSPPPKSLPVIVCSWVSKVNMVREVWGCWSCVFQSQGQRPSHQQIHASILCIMPLFTHKFCSSLEKHLAQIRQFTLELCVCVCVCR